MLLGVTLLRKKYPLAKYLCVLLIVGGVALFLYKPNKTSNVADDHVFGFGEILLVSLKRLAWLLVSCPSSNVTFWSRPCSWCPSRWTV